MIPKIIHYVWVGNNPKSDLVKKCIASWKKHCPDYKIIEWNNDSLKEINNIYVKEAFESKKWAFVSDYLRLYALKEYGGIYCDSDLEITQNLDLFLENEFFTGYENYNKQYPPITAIMGAQKNNPIISDLLDDYKNIHFIVDGKMDLTTNVKKISSYFSRQFNLKKPYKANIVFELNSTSKIYPSFFFCTPEFGKDNYSIHHFNGSWIEPYKRRTIFSIGSFSLIKIKEVKNYQGVPLPILEKEKIILGINKKSKRKYFLIKKEK